MWPVVLTFLLNGRQEATRDLVFGLRKARLVNFYTLTPEGFEQVKSRLLKRTIAFISLTLLIALFVVTGMSMNDEASGSSGPLSATIGLAIAAGILTFSGRRALQQAIDRQHETWKTYQLYLGPDYLIQRQAGRQDVKISRSQVTEIVESRTGDLIVKTAGKLSSICIPSSVQGYEEIKVALSTWDKKVNFS